MIPIEKERLHYRRQFLVGRKGMQHPQGWPCLELSDGKTLVYSHPDLEINSSEHDGLNIVLLGYLFDPSAPDKNNGEILADIINGSADFPGFLEVIKTYAGQYVFLYLGKDGLKVVPDPLALREVYYCDSDNGIICGAQPNLVAEYSDPKLKVTSDPLKLRFYEQDMKRLRSGRFWVGEETFYEGVRHLLPNHYLDSAQREAVRYWPRAPLKKVPFEQAISLASEYLSSVLKAASKRSDLMLAVTSGNDSRTLLAASRAISGSVYYFINRVKGLTDEHPDICVPRAIFKRLGLPFHVHDIPERVPDDFREIFLDNTFASSDLILPVIYNIYFLEHGDKLNILGVGEIGRSFYGKEPRGLDGYYLARSLKFKDSPYAVEQCRKWLDGTLAVAHANGVNVMTLLLWEQLLGNWGAVGNSESDIAIDEFDPFNSHYLYEILLGVEPRPHGKANDLFLEMIRKMWPELLEFPINPPRGRRAKLMLSLKKAGLYPILKSIAYRIDASKFRRKARRLSR